MSQDPPYCDHHWFNDQATQSTYCSSCGEVKIPPPAERAALSEPELATNLSAMASDLGAQLERIGRSVRAMGDLARRR